MIFVDTSVWVDFLRGRAPVALQLRDLLDDDVVALAVPVRVEILAGAPASEQRRLHRVLGALPTFLPTEATWARMEGWIARATPAGQRFGLGDLLVAAIAVDRDCPVWSLDHDFERMAALGFVGLHRPAG